MLLPRQSQPPSELNLKDLLIWRYATVQKKKERKPGFSQYPTAETVAKKKFYLGKKITPLLLLPTSSLPQSHKQQMPMAMAQDCMR